MDFKNFYSNFDLIIPLTNQLPWLSKQIHGNSLQSIAFALLMGIFLGLILKILKKLLAEKIKTLALKTENTWDDEIAHLVTRTKSWFIFVLGYYLSAQGLLLSEKFANFLNICFSFCFFFQILLWADRAILVAVRINSKTNAESHSELTDPKDIILSFLIRAFVFATMILLLLSNLGVNVSALITGLGVGGIALALAVQKILGDLLASISIALDKPFSIGDSIVVGTLSGTVEKIGLKTTRVRSVNGELIIVPNTDILTKSIQNYKELKERRIVLRLGIVYDTPEDKIKKVTDLITTAVSSVDKTRLERVHFCNFGPSSLDYEAVYWILDSQYIALMDAQQQVNYKILSLFNQEQIGFAYPSQTIYLNSKP